VSIADLIEHDLEKLARAESIDTGKPLSLAHTLDIPRAASNFRFFATAILHTESEAHITDNVAFNYTLRQPRGIAGLISPWNLPLYLLSWKIAPAIVVREPGTNLPVRFARVRRTVGLQEFRRSFHRQNVEAESRRSAGPGHGSRRGREQSAAR